MRRIISAPNIEVGDEAGTAEAFRGADHVVRLDTWVQRITGAPMEPRTTTAEYDATTRQIDQSQCRPFGS